MDGTEKTAEKDELPEELSVVDLLLRPEAPDVRAKLPTARYKVKRLSEAVGKPVVFDLRALPYNTIRRIQQDRMGQSALDIVLAGVVSPDFKDARLGRKYGGVTPEETVKAILLPGEIDELAIAIEKLSGYRAVTLERIKNA